MAIPVRAVAVFVLLALPMHCYAATDPASNGSDAETSQLLTPVGLDSPAQAAVRNLKTPDEKARPVKVAAAEIVHPDLVTRLEEIRVYGRNEPEDYVGRKISPMMQFRARLERDVPWSPAKKAQMALCMIGLCSIYGPEGIPSGDSPEVRADARLYQSTTQLNAQFRGTLQ